MIMLAADAQENRQRFIARAIEQEVVWFLEYEESTAYAESNEDDEAVVLLFWSDRAYAKRARKTGFKEYEVAEITLFEFIFKWLSGMADDEVLVGVNWTGDLKGQESDPEQLQDDLLQAMDEGMRSAYFEALQVAMDPPDEADEGEATD